MAERARWHDSLRVAGLVAVAAAMGVGGYFLLARATLTQGTPDYSSVRTDPQGTSILFGALQRAGLTVTRGFAEDSLAAMSPKDTVAFVLAPGAWSNHLADQLQAFTWHGGTVVLAGPPAPAPPALPDSAEAILTPPQAGLDQELGASLHPRRPEAAAAAPAFADAVAGAAPAGVQPLPLLDPRARLDLSPGWVPLYRHGGHTYMAVRKWGQGRVILSSEATFLSNENLAARPDVALLSWMAAGRRAVYVDETLHGLEQVRGTAWLLQRYRLQAAVVWLVLTLALMAWAAAATLERAAPRPEADGSEDAALGGGAAALTRLLQRTIPIAELPAACEKQFALARPRQAAAMQTPAPRAAAAVVAWYRLWQDELRSPNAVRDRSAHDE